MRKFISWLLLLALVLGCFSGCTRKIDNSAYVPTGNAIVLEGEEEDDFVEEEKPDQQLNLAYYPNRSLNPLFGSDYINRILMSLMYQPLFAVDNQKNVTPILCGKYQVSANGQNLWVYLDSGATFSDGSPVRPEDVVACYWQAKENDYYTNRFRHLTNIEVTEDGNGVLFQTDVAYQNLPLLLDVPIVKESELMVGVEDTSRVPLGSGPYVFHSGTGGYSLQRNPSWWCKDLKIAATDESIDLVEVTSTSDVRDAFQFNGAGSVSVVCTNPMSASFAEYGCDYELWEIESGYFMYIGCNILYSDFFEKDGGIRKFLTYGIDRESLAEDAYKGMVDAVTLPCAPAASYYNTYLAEQYEYNAMKFISYLSSFSIPRKDGVQRELQLLVNADDSARVNIARTLAKNLTSMGLPCVTVEYSSGVYQSQIQNGNYDIYLGLTRLSPSMDLSEFFRPWGEMSWGGLQHEVIYDMCKNALKDYGSYYNLYQKLAEDGRIIPVMFGYYNVYAQRGLLPDLTPARDNVFYYSMGKTMEDCLIEAEYE
ncbi:MAG: hypothetical protein IKJ84_04705 [Oscillospiraceae bacterium]|nr:hypothetical protein [Oscillospiraceae bacterium]